MSNQPLNSAALRGAVDLSSLKNSAAQAPASAPAAPRTPVASAGVSATSDDAQIAETFRHDGLVVDVTAENFSGLVQVSMQHPVIVAVWAASQPQSRQPIDVLAKAVRAQQGRVLLGVADLDESPQIGQVFAQLSQQAAEQGQPGQVLAAAFVQGQPIPIPPVVEQQVADELLQQIVQISVQNGIAGRVAGYDPHAAPGAVEADEEAALPALHQVAHDAIDAGDFEGAIAAYDQALKENPKDDEARIARGQVQLMKRTAGVDLQQARAAAASNPADVEAQMTVADLDLLGGHVEDAFMRLIDAVKASSGDERNAVREHLIELFDVVGVTDPRVKKARTSLMSALY